MELGEPFNFILRYKMRFKVGLTIAKRSRRTILIPRVNGLRVRNANALLVQETAIVGFLSVGFAFRDSG